jgi:glyoxylase-like metal-dependent hydrolase (beta-lactamase superfamily II)
MHTQVQGEGTEGSKMRILLRVKKDERVIMGDAVFESGSGKAWSPENFQTALYTLRRLILAWTDETCCYPGHSGPFLLADIRSAIESFNSRTTAGSAAMPRGVCEHEVRLSFVPDSQHI